MFPKRIRQARQAAGLSLQKLADRMNAAGYPITRAALNKYEVGKAAPTARTLLALSAALRIQSRHLLEDVGVRVEWLAFRRRCRMSKARQEQVRARAERMVEVRVRLERLLGEAVSASPRRTEVRSLDDAEHAAAQLRRAWKLGEAPIDSLTSVIEDHGGVVVEVEEAGPDFDGLSGIAEGKHPVVVIRGGQPADRRRFTLAHELGHLTMDVKGGDAKHEESCAHRFAAAFLVPSAVARRELGEHRRTVALEELQLLKERHGMSIQAWIRRALDVGIISPAAYRGLCVEVGRRGWRKVEPIVRDAERPAERTRQLLLRALSEDVLSHDQAYAIMPEVLPRTSDAPKHKSRLHKFLAISPAERDKALRKSAEAARHLYEEGGELRGFDALGPNDLLDNDDD